MREGGREEKNTTPGEGEESFRDLFAWTKHSQNTVLTVLEVTFALARSSRARESESRTRRERDPSHLYRFCRRHAAERRGATPYIPARDDDNDDDDVDVDDEEFRFIATREEK